MEIKDPIFAQLEKKIIIYKLLAGEFRMNQIFVNISFFFFSIKIKISSSGKFNNFKNQIPSIQNQILIFLQRIYAMYL